MKIKNIKKIAIKRVLTGKAEKADLQALSLWAKDEIKEWEKFLELIEDKIDSLRAK